MNKFIVLKKIKPKNPVFITGLPGIGLIGKLTVEHLIKELKAVKFAEFYSSDFPPQVIIENNTHIDLMKHEYHYIKEKNLEVIFITGDYQALSVAGNYDVAEEILSFVKKHKVKQILTLGGLGTGASKENPTVYGAYTDQKMRNKLKRFGVVFTKKTGGIVGAAGLLLGLGKFHKMSGVCMMGETHGQFIDATCAKKMVKIVAKYLGIKKVNTRSLDKKAKQIKEAIGNLQQMQAEQQKQFTKSQREDTMHYIR